MQRIFLHIISLKSIVINDYNDLPDKIKTGRLK